MSRNETILYGGRLAWWKTIQTIALWGIKMKTLHGIFLNQFCSSYKHKDQKSAVGWGGGKNLSVKNGIA